MLPTQSPAALRKKPPAREESTSDPKALRAKLEQERARFSGPPLAHLTVNGYGLDWELFTGFCKRLKVKPLPSTTDTLSLYVTQELGAGLKVATVKRRLAAIARKHRDAKLPEPSTVEVRNMLRCAMRQRLEQPKQVRPLTTDDLRAMSIALTKKGTPEAIRNRAILVVGFCSALRGASLVSLQMEDVEVSDKGIVLRITKEKQDQEGRGRLIGLPYGKHPETCPVSCLAAWLKVRGNRPGPLFCRVETNARLRFERPIGRKYIWRIVKRAVALIGGDPAAYGAHSMRSGFVTSAGEAGAGDLLIAAQTGHRDVAMVRRYFRRSDLFRSNAAGVLDL